MCGILKRLIEGDLAQGERGEDPPSLVFSSTLGGNPVMIMTTVQKLLFVYISEAGREEGIFNYYNICMKKGYLCQYFHFSSYVCEFISYLNFLKINTR